MRTAHQDRCRCCHRRVPGRSQLQRPAESPGIQFWEDWRNSSYMSLHTVILCRVDDLIMTFFNSVENPKPICCTYPTPHQLAPSIPLQFSFTGSKELLVDHERSTENQPPKMFNQMPPDFPEIFDRFPADFRS